MVTGSVLQVNVKMVSKNLTRSVDLLRKSQNEYCAKRHVHRQLLSKMFPSFGASVVSSSIPAAGSLSYKVSGNHRSFMGATLCVKNVIVI